MVHDWRLLSGGQAAALHDAEGARWLSRLHWDTRASLARVEAARHAGTLPGVAAIDEAGAVRGWTFFLVHDTVLQIGAFAADSPQVTSALLDAVAKSPEAASASAALVFAFTEAPELSEELRRRGFDVERYRYLQKELGAKPQLPPDPVDERRTVAAWRPSHRESVAVLLRRAYPTEDAARPFARGGAPEAWLEYVTQLILTRACGTFWPEASRVIAGARPSELEAVALMTRLTKDAAHLAQIAVSPTARGLGLARQLIGASLQAAHAGGCRYATLLVSERNAAAEQLYAAMGFEEVASFVSAACDQPRRFGIAGRDAGGAITLR